MLTQEPVNVGPTSTVLIRSDNVASGLFHTLGLLQAYERAIDENIISTITDTQGVIMHANKRFCEVSGFTSDEVIGQKHNLVNSGYHPREFFREMWRTIGNGEVWHDEIRNRAKDGSFYWVDTVIVPIADTNGGNTHYLSLRTLITERKATEQSKHQYVSSLEVLLVMTSNRIQKPLEESLRQMSAFDLNKVSVGEDMKRMISNLKQSVTELDGFIKELTTFIREIDHK